MLSIPWTDLVTKDDVPRRTGYQRNLIPTMRKRQLLFLGHIIRKEGLEEVALTGKIDGRKGKGRQEMTSIAAWTRKKDPQLIKCARDRSLWRGMIANVLGGHGT